MIRSISFVLFVTILILSVLILSACGGSGGGGGTGTKVLAAPSAVENPTIIAYGDSTMYGQGDLIQQKLTYLGSTETVANRGVGGAMLQDLLTGTAGYSQTLADALAKEPAARIVMENYGINEARHLVSVDDYKDHLRAFISTVRASGKIPVILTASPTFMSDLPEKQRMGELIEAVRLVASETGTRLIDIHDQFAAVTTRDDLRDELHPTNEFYSRIADYEARQLVGI